MGRVPRSLPGAVARAAAPLLVVALVALVALFTGITSARAAVPEPPAGLVVEPDRVEPGARDVTLVFRMTDEDPAVPAVRLQLLLPTARPLVGVTAPAPPGWTAQLTTTVPARPAPSADGPVTEVVSAIEWTASAPRTPGPVAFPVQVRLMPTGAGPVRFRAVQTDASGRSVAWTDSWADGGPRPAHATLEVALGAPVPAVPVADHGDHHGGHGVPPPAAATGPVDGGGVVTVLVGGLLVAALAAALVVALGRRQHRRFQAVLAARDGRESPDGEPGAARRER